MNRLIKSLIAAVVAVAALLPASAQELSYVGLGWANNSVNTTVFRKNSVVTHGDTQFTAYYDDESYMVLAKRTLGSDDWESVRTQYQGNVRDAHNSISIMVDGDGFLHVSWDHHNNPLRYARGVAPLSLELGEKEPMDGRDEMDVCYPEFYKLPSGDLIFMYREGSSGRGNLVMNRYDLKTRRWTHVQSNLISGENQRNAYWQAFVDPRGVIHVSWVWRESWLVETNHDMAYARSEDGGVTWTDSKGRPYALPIVASTAEYVATIPQNSELINQTSMTTDSDGRAYIATYWRDAHSDAPQYRIIYNDGDEWRLLNTGFRTLPFSLSGGGTKRIPIARPQIIVSGEGEDKWIGLVFRDEERGSPVSMAVCTSLADNTWLVSDLTDFSVGSWEPSFDTELWRERGELHIFIQKVEQIDGEGRANIEPTPVRILSLNGNALSLLRDKGELARKRDIQLRQEAGN